MRILFLSLLLSACASQPPQVQQVQVVEKKLVVDKIKSLEDVKNLLRVIGYSWTYSPQDKTASERLAPIKNLIE